jgi:hypothetical protein
MGCGGVAQSRLVPNSLQGMASFANLVDWPNIPARLTILIGLPL